MANKHSIMTREMVESFCNSYYIPDEVHPTAPGRDVTITQFPEGKVGVYTRLFDYCGYRIPLTKFFVAVLKHFRIHISQLSPFGAARVSHFEVLTRVLNLAPSVAVFRAPLFLKGRRVPRTHPDTPPSASHLTVVKSMAVQVQAVEVQKGEEQVTLLESIKHCFVSLDAPAAVHQASGSGSGAGPEVSAPSAGGNVVLVETGPKDHFQKAPLLVGSSTSAALCAITQVTVCGAGIQTLLYPRYGTKSGGSSQLETSEESLDSAPDVTVDEAT
ncbi:hypothetical protein Tco_0001328 [Tanacetum coccineum]